MNSTPARLTTLEIAVPDWLTSVLPPPNYSFKSDEEKARLVIELSKLNVTLRTGGPFAAAVFEEASGILVAAAPNVVVPSHCSTAHGETLALSLAQKAIKNHTLRGIPGNRYSLVTSTEPCAMCFGAILWSGIEQLICCARGEDAVAVGFDEGPKVKDWRQVLNERGISLKEGVLREEAKSVLNTYKSTGGQIYNGN